MIWSIQALRFVAALMVVYVHAAPTALAVTGSLGLPPGLVAVGFAGVDIFFVISGFIIAKAATGRTAAEFLTARLIRILPLYLVFASQQAIFAGLAGRPFGWREAIATFLFWPATDRMTSPALDVGWTLAFEMLFYAAAALVLTQRRGIVPLTYVAVGAWAVAFTLRPAGPVFQFLGNPLILEFMAGVVIAQLPRLCRAASALGFGAIVLGATLLMAAGTCGVIPPMGEVSDFLIGEHNLTRVLVLGLPAALIVYGTVQIEMREGLWSYLGDVSYALYLSHYGVLKVLTTIWLWLPSASPSVAAVIAVGTTASILFAWRVHELLEKPMLTALRWRQQTGAAQARLAG